MRASRSVATCGFETTSGVDHGSTEASSAGAFQTPKVLNSTPLEPGGRDASNAAPWGVGPKRGLPMRPDGPKVCDSGPRGQNTTPHSSLLAPRPSLLTSASNSVPQTHCVPADGCLSGAGPVTCFPATQLRRQRGRRPEVGPEPDETCLSQ